MSRVDVTDTLAAMLERAERMMRHTDTGNCDADDVAEICTDLPRLVRALQRGWPTLNEEQLTLVEEELSK